MTHDLERGDARWEYAKPEAPLDFEPFRQSNQVPDWADQERRYPKLPIRDYGTYRQSDQEIYSSPEILRRDWQNIFKKVWMLVGHITERVRRDTQALLGRNRPVPRELEEP